MYPPTRIIDSVRNPWGKFGLQHRVASLAEATFLHLNRTQKFIFASMLAYLPFNVCLSSLQCLLIFTSMFAYLHFNVPPTIITDLVRNSWGDFGLPVVQHRVASLAEVTFLHVNRRQKLPRGKCSLAHAHY